MKNEHIFPCYSFPMKQFFDSKGIRYELNGINPNTGKMFWIYLVNEKVQQAMREWSK